MNWKIASFIIVPLILFGCTALHYMYQTNDRDRLRSENLPHSQEIIDDYLKDLNGPKR